MQKDLAKRYRRRENIIDSVISPVWAIQWDGGIYGDTGADAIEEWSNGKTSCRGETVGENISLIIEVQSEYRRHVAYPGYYIVKKNDDVFFTLDEKFFEMVYEEDI